jgi:chaperonin GroES
MCDIEPIEYRLIVKPEPVEKKTEGGIIIPETTQDKERHAVCEAEVVKMSDMAFTGDAGERWKCEHLPKVGDKVFFAKYAGMRIKRDDDNYIILNDKDILGVITA